MRFGEGRVGIPSHAEREAALPTRCLIRQKPLRTVEFKGEVRHAHAVFGKGISNTVNFFLPRHGYRTCGHIDLQRTEYRLQTRIRRIVIRNLFFFDAVDHRVKEDIDKAVIAVGITLRIAVAGKNEILFGNDHAKLTAHAEECKAVVAREPDLIAIAIARTGIDLTAAVAEIVNLLGCCRSNVILT